MNDLDILLNKPLDRGNKIAEGTNTSLSVFGSAMVFAGYASLGTASVVGLTSGVMTGGIALIPLLCFSLYIYNNQKIKKLRLIVANNTLDACINIIKDLCKINMFYTYTQEKYNDFDKKITTGSKFEFLNSSTVITISIDISGNINGNTFNIEQFLINEREKVSNQNLFYKELDDSFDSNSSRTLDVVRLLALISQVFQYAKLANTVDLVLR